MHKSHFSPKKIPHYLRVVWYRIIRPRVWSFVVQKRVAERQAANFPTDIIPLFFNAQWHFSLRHSLPNHLSLAEILAQAEQAINHHFTIFSNDLREHGKTLDWHKDYTSGMVWDALKPAPLLDFMQSREGSDVKYAWELSRCHWFTWLGLAYILENEEFTNGQNKERYAEAFKHDVESWIATNPLGMGINWAMPMEVAIRATNWIFAASFFHTSPTLDAAFWQVFMRVLWQHGQHLAYNLEFVRNNANHFMSNAMGLVVLGAFFQQQGQGQGNIRLARDGKRWFRIGKRFMEREILRQFYPDGINYEKSTSYHRFVTEMCTVAIAAAECINESFQNQYYERLRRAHSYIVAYTRTDGSAPRIGDTDNGRVLRYFALEDFNNHLKNIELEQLFFSTKNLPPKTPSVHAAYPHGNYVIWKNDHVHFFADVGDYGMNGWGGHGHNDCLSFELWAAGKSLLIDSGTGCYTSNTELRNELRSTKAHNTVMVEEAEQTEYAGLWRIKRDELSPSVITYSATEQGLTLIAEHSAYVSRFGIKHRRTFDLQLDEQIQEQKRVILKIRDELLPKHTTNAAVSGNIHFILSDEMNILESTPEGLSKEIRCAGGDVVFNISNKAGCRIEPCRISLFYGDVREGRRIVIPISNDAASETLITCEWS